MMQFSPRAFGAAGCRELALASYPAAVANLPFRRTRTQVPRGPARFRSGHALDQALTRQTVDEAYIFTLE